MGCQALCLPLQFSFTPQSNLKWMVSLVYNGGNWNLLLHHLRVVSQLISGGAGFRRNPFWLEARLKEIVLHVADLPHHSPKRALPRATSEGPAKFRNCRHLCLWLFAAIGEIDHCSPQSLMLFYTCVFQMAKRLIVFKKKKFQGFPWWSIG